MAGRFFMRCCIEAQAGKPQLTPVVVRFRGILPALPV